MKRDIPKKTRDRVLYDAAFTFGITVQQILSNRRDSEFVTARRVVAKEFRELGYSFPAIGRAMNRHHSSIIHMVSGSYREHSNALAREWHEKKAKLLRKG